MPNPPMSPKKRISLSGNAGGIVLILAGSLFAVASSAQTKLLSADFSPFQIAWMRSVITLLCISPFLVRTRFKGIWPNRPALMTFRSLNGAALVMLNVYAVGRLALVDFTAIGFTTPIFVIILSFFFLGHRPRAGRSLATLVGFMGVLMIVQPSGQLEPAMLAALGGAMCLALGLILVRMLARTESQLVLLLWSSGMVFVLLGPVMLVSWQPPSPEQWAIVVTAGVMGTLTQTCILYAYERGEPTVIAPFDYSRILFAVLAGMILFEEIPNWLSLVGAIFVVLAGFYIARSNRA